MSGLAARTEVDGGLTTLSLAGEIDLANAEDLRRELAGAADGRGLLVVDLSEVTYLDSAGIGELFTAAARLRADDGALVVVVPPDSPLRRLLRITQFEQAATVVDSRAEVVDRADGPPVQP